MVWIVAAAIAVVLVVVAMLALRRKPPVAMPAAPEPAPVSLPPQPAVATPANFERVSCMLSGAVHGAMPPFGRLTMADDVLSFAASSRVVTKTGALSDDGSATVQSLGSVEMGQFRFDWPLSAVTGCEFASQTVTLHCDGLAYQIEALGGRGAALSDWLKAQGVFRG